MNITRSQAHGTKSHEQSLEQALDALDQRKDDEWVTSATFWEFNPDATDGGFGWEVVMSRSFNNAGPSHLPPQSAAKARKLLLDAYHNRSSQSDQPTEADD